MLAHIGSIEIVWNDGTPSDRGPCYVQQDIFRDDDSAGHAFMDAIWDHCHIIQTQAIIPNVLRSNEFDAFVLA